ncbi:basic salivary proline-rich protein 2-like [Melozone crissalis]|uniref:basic salivary proline-rich protein 2-like n=1 Tax=Melozone crissalis TaxID=40204 RepID=UPI0023DBC7AE|nr:basic salivary proline-rich protein 2-like [Melozone crissalis]
MSSSCSSGGEGRLPPRGHRLARLPPALRRRERPFPDTPLPPSRRGRCGRDDRHRGANPPRGEFPLHSGLLACALRGGGHCRGGHAPFLARHWLRRLKAPPPAARTAHGPPSSSSSVRACVSVSVCELKGSGTKGSAAPPPGPGPAAKPPSPLPPPNRLAPGPGTGGRTAGGAAGAGRGRDVNIPQKGSPERGAWSRRWRAGPIRRVGGLLTVTAARPRSPIGRRFGTAANRAAGEAGRGRGALLIRTFFFGGRSPPSSPPSLPLHIPFLGAAANRANGRSGLPPCARRGGISRGTEKRAALRRGGRQTVTPSYPPRRAPRPRRGTGAAPARPPPPGGGARGPPLLTAPGTARPRRPPGRCPPPPDPEGDPAAARSRFEVRKSGAAGTGGRRARGRPPPAIRRGRGPAPVRRRRGVGGGGRSVPAARLPGEPRPARAAARPPAPPRPAGVSRPRHGGSGGRSVRRPLGALRAGRRLLPPPLRPPSARCRSRAAAGPPPAALARIARPRYRPHRAPRLPPARGAFREPGGAARSSPVPALAQLAGGVAMKALCRCRCPRSGLAGFPRGSRRSPAPQRGSPERPVGAAPARKPESSPCTR